MVNVYYRVLKPNYSSLKLSDSPEHNYSNTPLMLKTKKVVYDLNSIKIQKINSLNKSMDASGSTISKINNVVDKKKIKEFNHEKSDLLKLRQLRSKSKFLI